MVVVMRPGASAEEVDAVVARVEGAGGSAFVSRGVQRTIVGLVGDVVQFTALNLRAMAGVVEVVRVSKPYKLVSRENHPDASTITVGERGDVHIGPDTFVLIAGPCAVETAEQTFEAADMAKAAGATMLRGGAYKPRTSPYAFQGLGVKGLEILVEARERTGLPVVTEVVDPKDVAVVAEHADMLQIGARNMQNFALLSEVGRVQRPVLLKRGLSATVKELLMAAEYIMAQGNRDVILCERGIRTFETATRNTFDVAAIPVLKAETHLPVLVDPSHAGGRADLVAPLTFAAIAAGADGLIIEVHPSPEDARSDGDQSLTFEAFAEVMRRARPFAEAAGRTMAAPTPVRGVAAA